MPTSEPESVGTDTYTVDLIRPRDAEPFTPHTAFKFLTEALPPLQLISTLGYDCDNADDRQAFRELSIDLSTITEAAVAVLCSEPEAPIHVKVNGEAKASRALRLARILTHRDALEIDGPHKAAFAELAALLARTVVEDAADPNGPQTGGSVLPVPVSGRGVRTYSRVASDRASPRTVPTTFPLAGPGIENSGGARFTVSLDDEPETFRQNLALVMRDAEAHVERRVEIMSEVRTKWLVSLRSWPRAFQKRLEPEFMHWSDPDTFERRTPKGVTRVRKMLEDGSTEGFCNALMPRLHKLDRAVLAFGAARTGTNYRRRQAQKQLHAD